MTGAQDTVDQLAHAVGWHGIYTDDPGWPEFWSKLEAACGHGFPADIQKYVERFPPGDIAMLYVFHPLDGSGTVDDRIANYARRVNNYHVALNDSLDLKPGFPSSFGVNPGQLIVWGAVQRDYVLCWETTSAIPEEWPVVVCGTSFSEERQRYPGPAVQLLLDMAIGRDPLSLINYVCDEPFVFYPPPVGQGWSQPGSSIK